ncbi:hypothetical protein Tco_1449306 [Tanacetum coccineum]
MANLSHLQELTAVVNSNNLTDAIRVNELRLLTSELNVFGGPLAVQCAKFLNHFFQKEVFRMLELRKMIAEVQLQVHREIDFLTVLRFY